MSDPGRRESFRPGRWQRVRAGAVTWRVDPAWRDGLIGPEGLRLAQWREQGALATVKSGPHRVVYRAELPQGAVYIKHYLVPNVRAVLRQWFRRGKGRNEGRRAAELARLGVPTIEPVALGEQRRRGFLLDNYLITREIAGMAPLDEFLERRLSDLPEPGQTRLRQELTRRLAVLTARLHDAGLLHHDFHPGNVLVGVGPDGPHLAMIDLDALRSRRHVSWRAARHNLARLDHYFWLRSNRTDRYRFVCAYLQARRGGDAVDPRRLALGVARETRFWAERLWRRWGARCQGSNKYFRARRTAAHRAIGSRELPRGSLLALLADPMAPFAHRDAVTIKSSRTATVAALPGSAVGANGPSIWKRFHVRAWYEPLLALFRPSRAWRAWQGAQHFVSRGLPTPRNLALITQRGWLGLPRAQYLLTEKVEPAMTLADYAREVLPKLAPDQRRIQILRLIGALARLVRSLHERSLSDRDLKASNLLLRGDPAAAELTVIDLVGVELRRHPLPDRHRAQNLARLALSLLDAAGVTRTDALRFLRLYLPWGLARRGAWKPTWNEVAARMADKVAQNRRRGRPLS